MRTVYERNYTIRMAGGGAYPIRAVVHDTRVLFLQAMTFRLYAILGLILILLLLVWAGVMQDCEDFSTDVCGYVRAIW